jgi:chaperonin GroES
MLESKIIPIFDRIIIKRDEEVTQTKSGIFIAASAGATEKPNQGVVVAVGCGRPLDNGEFRPMQIKVGDKVLFSKFTGTEATIDDVTYTIITENDVMGIIKE